MPYSGNLNLKSIGHRGGLVHIWSYDRFQIKY